MGTHSESFLCVIVQAVREREGDGWCPERAEASNPFIFMQGIIFTN